MMWTILKFMGLNNQNHWQRSLARTGDLWLIRVTENVLFKWKKIILIILQAVYHESVITSSLSFSIAKTVMIQSITLSTEDYSILYEAPQLVLILWHQSFCKRRRPAFFKPFISLFAAKSLYGVLRVRKKALCRLQAPPSQLPKRDYLWWENDRSSFPWETFFYVCWANLRLTESNSTDNIPAPELWCFYQVRDYNGASDLC